MPTSQQRSEVWRGARKKTSGGLTKESLTKNKRGKIVSKKKSEQASSQNNLGSWLRERGKKVEKAKMLRKGSDPPADAPKSKKKVAKKAAAAPPQKAVPVAAAVKKAAPKKAPKKAAPKKAVKQAAPKRKKVKKKPGINPLTQQPYDRKEPGGYVAGGNVSLDNVILGKRKRKKRTIGSF